MESRRGLTSRRLATKSPPRNKSPTRKSPARKSPSRKVEPPIKEEIKVTGRKSPARKSPGRKVEPPVKEVTKRRGRPKVNAPQPKSVSPKAQLLKVSLSPIKHESNRATATTKTVTTTSTTSVQVSNILNESDDEIKHFVANRINEAKAKLGSLRYSATPSEVSRQSMSSRSVSRTIVDDEDGDEYSDRETEPIHDEGRTKYTYQQESKKPSSSIWIGLGVLVFILLISTIGFYLQFACTREECNLIVGRLEKLKTLKAYGNREAILLYLGFISTLLLLSPLPIGRFVQIKNEKQTISYNFNGFGLAIIIGIGIAVAEYLKYPIIRLIYGNYQQLCFISIVHALILSLWRYILNRKVPAQECNPYARSGSFWIDYFVGREINALWCNIFDLKLVHYRAAVIATLVFNGIFIYRNLKFAALPTENGNITLSVSQVILFTYNNVKYDPIALLTACLVFWHALDLLLFEHHLISSLHLQAEGVGAFLLLRNALFPFFNTLISKYAWEHKITGVPVWAVITTIVTFFIGWLLKRGSDNIKYQFRTNPSNPKFNYADTIPTFQLKRLLVFSYWGLIRQPNYLGEIISYLSLLIPLIWRFAWPPFVAILVTVVHLIFRAKQLSTRNFNRYNSAWTRYCQRVKYLLLPKVY